MNLTSSNSVSTDTILSGKVPKKSVGCATYYSIKALTNSTLCATAVSADGGDCQAASAALALVKVSWAFVMAVVLVALGFTS